MMGFSYKTEHLACILNPFKESAYVTDCLVSYYIIVLLSFYTQEFDIYNIVESGI